MKLVVLDGFTVNPGDLSWGDLEALGDLMVYERTAPEDLLARSARAQVLLTNKTVIGAEDLGQLPELRYIGVLATGVNVVDLAAAQARGIPVTNVPAYSTASVAQAVLAHIFNLAQRTGEHAASVRLGEWAACPDFSYSLTPQVELAGKTIGLVGFGSIGQQVANIATAIGMQVLAYSPSKLGRMVGGVEVVPLDRILTESDVVSIHCPLTPETENLFDAATLARMKLGAWLINTARGPIVVEQALADALTSGQIGGAGLDVLCQEPPRIENPLYAAPNCYISPHNAWATREARQRLLAVAIANVRGFANRTWQNVVNQVVPS